MTSEHYGFADCENTENNAPIAGKVVIAQGQIYLCTDEPNPNVYGKFERTVSLVSLSDGERRKMLRSEVLGTLRSELLPDSAKLQLSQVRPGGFGRSEAVKYRGYCFLPSGRYSAGVRLGSGEEAVAYVKLQLPYQWKILVCNALGGVVLELKNGKIVRISEEMRAFL
jgi:hypothetical protein